MYNEKIKLCYIVNNFEVGGLEKVVIDLINNLPRDKFNIFLICLSGKGKLYSEAIENVCQDILVLEKSSGKDYKIIFKIRKFLNKNKIDIIHAHNMAPLIYGGIASKMIDNSPAILFTEHNQIYRLSKWAKFKFKHFYLKFADKIITVSEKLKEYYLDILKVKKDITTVHNGINGSKFFVSLKNGLREELSIKRDDLVIGTAVVLSEQKGLKYLIDAAKNVCSEFDDIRFVIAGDGPLYCELKKQISDYKLDGKVILAGYRGDIPELLSAFDIYILPSLWEGFPLALLEAMASGKYIIASDVGGNSEIIENGVNGVLVPPGNSRILAEKIREAYLSRTLLGDYIPVNRDKFLSNFSFEKMIETHSFIYESYAKK